MEYFQSFQATVDHGELKPGVENKDGAKLVVYVWSADFFLIVEA